MLDFFRSPQFWAVFIPAVFAAALGGFYWSNSPNLQRILRVVLLGAPAFVVWVYLHFGIAAAAVTAVTGIVIAAIAKDLGTERLPDYAVIASIVTEPAESDDPSTNFKLAS